MRECGIYLESLMVVGKLCEGWGGSGWRHIKNEAQGIILLYSHSVCLCFDTLLIHPFCVACYTKGA